jgi:multiple sugar transport system permease protein
MFSKKHGLWLQIKINKESYFLVLPVVLFILIFQLYPLLDTIRLSFTNTNFLIPTSGKFVGFSNYYNILFNDSVFWMTVKNSFLWVFVSLIFQFILGLITAMLLNKKIPGLGLWRSIILIPWVTPVVVMGIIWRWIFNGDFGILNYALQQLHLLKEPVIWLGEKPWIWPSMLLTSVWKGYPYMAIMMLAGLQGIPESLYEVASIDGAGAVTKFFKITLPCLLPVIFVTFLSSVIISWTKFELIWVLTHGGPGFDTSVMATYVYSKSFLYYQMGNGATIATISSIIMVLFLVLYYRFFNPADSNS